LPSAGIYNYGGISGTNAAGILLGWVTRSKMHPVASWTMSGTDSASVISNNGTLAITGALTVTGEIDPASIGLFGLAAGSELEIAAHQSLPPFYQI
jgi:hypothetical protein